ncbi:RNA polymerase sigma factor [Parabacteroides sp. PF5-6]|uniref:RNA polymerase sigma factor n=1 Tax=Parabacteroides sp. PF5-6 TaxID=1742403 RepID=UPI002404F508|nr:RNA polymerase sigma factor [Parabacteroides sp. PF5-6]MDF9829743.1 RNA polymerase sigma factor (sigma-70 family) [Parabacteroides sp. PF5-6]
MNTHQFQQNLVGLQDNMLNFALKLTANSDEAHELLQDTTLKVLDNQEKYIDNTNFKGWVLTIMRNIFINNYHKVVRTQTMVDQYADLYNLEVLSEASFDSPETSYRIQEINQAIEKLEDDLRIPFSFYLSGYKYHEIADQLAMPLGTVKSRIYFARQELQQNLKELNLER